MKNLSKTLIIIVFVTFAFLAKAQPSSNIDSLINDVKIMPEDTNKVNTYLMIFKKLVKTDINLALIFAKKSEVLSKELTYPKGEVNSLLAQTMGLTFKGKFDSAKFTIERAIKIASENRFEVMQAKANMYYGNVLLETNEYEEAAKFFLKALKYYEMSDNKNAASGIYNNIGGIYSGLKNEEKALEYYKKAILNIDTVDRMYHIVIYNIATSKKNIGKLDEALEDYFKSLSIEINNNDSMNIAKTYNGIALTYKAKKEYDTAVIYFNKSLEIKEKNKNPKLISSTLNNLSAIYNIKRDYENAIQLANRSYQLSKSAKAKNEIFFSLENLYFAYEKSGKYEEALKFYKLYYQATDSLFYINEEAKELISDYELENRNKKLELQKAESKNKTYFIIVLLLIFFIVEVLFLFYIKNQKNKHQQKIIEERAKEAEAQKKRFAKELHDGTGNNLTGIRLQILALKEKINANGEFSEIIKEIDRTHQSVRLLSYQVVPPEFDNYTLDEATHDLVRRLTKTGSIKINYTSLINLDWSHTKKEFQLEIYRIIQEALSNVIKHSEAKNVDIQLIQHDNSFNLIIEDDGKGFIYDNINKGLGLNNITQRVKNIKGTLNIDSTIGKGTSIIIDFPTPKIKTMVV